METRVSALGAYITKNSKENTNYNEDLCLESDDDKKPSTNNEGLTYLSKQVLVTEEKGKITARVIKRVLMKTTILARWRYKTMGVSISSTINTSICFNDSKRVIGNIVLYYMP